MGGDTWMGSVFFIMYLIYDPKIESGVTPFWRTLYRLKKEGLKCLQSFPQRVQSSRYSQLEITVLNMKIESLEKTY